MPYRPIYAMIWCSRYGKAAAHDVCHAPAGLAADTETPLPKVKLCVHFMLTPSHLRQWSSANVHQIKCSLPNRVLTMLLWVVMHAALPCAPPLSSMTGDCSKGH